MRARLPYVSHEHSLIRLRIRAAWRSRSIWENRETWSGALSRRSIVGYSGGLRMIGIGPEDDDAC
jgi:hypothetical protein